jgi:hypothetical protein
MTYHGNYVFEGYQILNQGISYQGYFKSGNTGVTASKWSPVYTTNFTGALSCNLSDTAWLGTATVPTGSSVVFVFWETIAGADRTSPTVLHGRRGWFEIAVTNGATYDIYPVVAATDLLHTYTDNMPDRYGDLEYEYSFHYSDVLNEIYECEPFNWCMNTYPFTCQYTPSTILMSHESSIYGQQIFATVTSIRETLTFKPDGGYTQRTQSPTTTDFTHSFNTFQRSRLVRTLEYQVGGVYYPDTLYSGTLFQYQIIGDFFVELIIKDPAWYDINVYKDRDFKLKLLTDRVDFWTFKAQIKESFKSPTILAEFDIEVNKDEEYLELSLDYETTSNLLNDVSIDSSSTSTNKTLVWDLKIVNPVYRTYNLIHGNCYVHNTTTRGD